MRFRVTHILVVNLVTVLAVGLVSLTSGQLHDSRRAEAGVKPEISLSAHGPGVKCDGEPSVSKGDVTKPLKCDVPTGGAFVLSIEANAAPANGYAGFVTELNYGALAYDKMLTSDVEVIAPGCAFSFREQAPSLSLVAHGCATGVAPPFPKNHFIGNIVELKFNCTASQSSNSIDLLPEGFQPALIGGTRFIEFGTEAVITPNVDSLGINCGPKQQHPGDTDGDGCSDVQENGLDEKLGGLRDYKSPWDFYDVLGGGGGPPDQIIDLTNDILGVIQHYAPLGTEPEYDVNFDRGPSTGPNPWNMTAPDGVIDLTNDILGVILQFQHSCQ